MRIFDRHIARTIVTYTFFVLLVLVAVDAIFVLVGELQEVGKGSYSFFRAMEFVVLTVPARIYLLFPTSLLMGTLLGLGALASQSELIVMRAAGISSWRIVLSAIKTGFLLVLVVMLVGESAAPYAEQYAQEMRASALSKRISLQGQHGLWIKDGERFLNIGAVMPGLLLRDVRIYEFDNEQLVYTAHAQTARFEQQGHWLMQGLQFSTFTDQGVIARYVETDIWPTLIDLGFFNVLRVDPEILTAFDLYRYVRYLHDNHLEAARYELALWAKAVMPFSSMVMLLLGLPFVFGAIRTTGAGQRIFIGCMIGVAYFLVNKLINHMGLLYGVSPFLSAWAPVTIFAVIAVVVLRKAIR